MTYLLLWIYSLILSVSDIRDRAVPAWLLGVGSVAGLLYRGAEMISGTNAPGFVIRSTLLGLLPGIFMIVVALATQKSGCGDGWMLLNIGLVTNYREAVFIWGISIFLMAACSVLLLLLKKVNPKTRLPYLPFVAIALLWILSDRGINV